MARHPDICTSLGADSRPNRPRLGFLHHGHRSTEIYERRTEVQRERKRTVVISSLRSDVVGIHEFRLAMRLVGHQRVHGYNFRQEVLHHRR